MKRYKKGDTILELKARRLKIEAMSVFRLPSSVFRLFILAFILNFPQIILAQTMTMLNSGSITNKITSITGLNNCIWDTYDFKTACMDEITPVTGYQFFIDDETGDLMYGDIANPCSATKLSCVQFCNSMILDNVISASSNVFSSENVLDSDLKENFEISSVENPFESAEKGKWHVKSTYAYKTDITSIYDDVAHSYEAGVFTDFAFFNWNDITKNDAAKWLQTNNSNFFSVDGRPLENKNIMNIYSTTKYGYNNTLNYLVAYNSKYESTLFESFEYKYANGIRCGAGAAWNCFEEMGIDDAEHDLSTTEAHAGSQSVKLGGFSSVPLSIGSYKTELPLFYDREINTQMTSKGLSVKIWVKSSGNWPTITLEENSGDTLFTAVAFEEVARSGDWKLYEAKATDWDIVSGTRGTASYSKATEFGATIVFKLSAFAVYNATPTLPDVYVDDVRMQPLDAKMTTYVYDPNTFKMLTQFDDQHFGIFYQYTKEGKLRSILRETERGLKTVKETEYNIPVSSR